MQHVKKSEFKLEALIEHRKLDAGIIFASIVLGVFLGWNIVEIAIFSVFIWSIIESIPSRYLAAPALFFLLFTPILLVLGREEQAEEVAIYAYYFLVMAVIRAIIEIRSEENTDQPSEK